VLSGSVDLILDDGAHPLAPGDSVVPFRAGSPLRRRACNCCDDTPVIVKR
jgi:uncharacterized cupin superfamily protein